MDLGKYDLFNDLMNYVIMEKSHLNKFDKMPSNQQQIIANTI